MMKINSFKEKRAYLVGVAGTCAAGVEGGRAGVAGAKVFAFVCD